MFGAVNPLTFLPARAMPVGPVPRVGELAPAADGRLGGGPAVVVFLRHVGCPFAEATFLALHEQAGRTTGVRFVAVSHAPPEATAGWCQAVAGGPGRVEVVIDDGRALYAAWGLGRSSLSHFLGARSLRGVVALSRQGIRNRHPVGTRWQSAGAFGVDGERVVRFVHVPAHAGELPDLAAAADAAAGGGSG